jgi:hypothetical protein
MWWSCSLIEYLRHPIWRRMYAVSSVKGSLLEYYRGWIVERWEACALEDEHPGGIHHCHSVNRIVARKPDF